MRKVTFTFGGHTDSVVPRSKRRQICGFCFTQYHAPDVYIDLYGFDTCPACVLSGPDSLAKRAKEIAGNRLLIVEQWRWKPGSMDDDEALGMAMQYKIVERGLRGVKSFEDLPGGDMAVAIAKTARNVQIKQSDRVYA